MENKRVLQVNKLYYPYTGGIEKIAQQLAEGLKDQVSMEVLVCQEKGKTIKETVDTIPVVRAGSLGILFSLPISFPFLWNFNKMSKRMDIIHFHMPFPLGDLACLLSGYKGKVVLSWHSDVVRQKFLMKFYRPIMELFLKRADVIIVATEGHITSSSYLPKYKDKCVVIPYGVDKAIEQRADEFIARSVKENKEIIDFLFVGRLVYYKGCDILIDAFKDIKGARLTLVGSGTLESSLKEQVKVLGIENKVSFLGSIDENQLTREFENCDIFVLPSVKKSEAFGLVQIEAMVYGKPVINTNLHNGVPCVSLDHITGLTVPPEDVNALYEAMQWMVDHKEEREEMGRRARQRVKDYYRVETMLNNVMDTYHNLIQE
jgi:Glycosyltransferase